MLNFVICDDNSKILQKLSVTLENIFTKYNYDGVVSYQTNDVEDLLKYVDENKIDVLFLDINLKSKTTGLEVAEIIRKKNKNIYLIFMTGHLEYAMLAYKFKTFDYIAKPFTVERLEDTIVRLFDDIRGLPRKYIKIDNKNTILDENEVEYIKKDGMKVVFHTVFREYEAYSSFNKLESSLPNNFFRCHKSFVINLNNVKNVDFVENRIYFQNNDFCEIGKKKKKSLIGVFDSYGVI